jgi:hypothetical protein
LHDFADLLACGDASRKFFEQLRSRRRRRDTTASTGARGERPSAIGLDDPSSAGKHVVAQRGRSRLLRAVTSLLGRPRASIAAGSGDIAAGVVMTHASEKLHSFE